MTTNCTNLATFLKFLKWQYATIWPKMSPTKLLCAFLLSRLDYCSSRLAGCPKYLLSKLQKLQNNATRLIFRTTRSAHVTTILHSLHWLPNEERIHCSLSLLCIKIISHQAVIYLSELLHLYTPSRQLRSSTDSVSVKYIGGKKEEEKKGCSLRVSVREKQTES